MRNVFLSSILFLSFFSTAHSQGCVIVRNISGFGHYNFTDKSYSVSTWQINVISRYFKSFRDFKGSVDQKTPEPAINHVFSTDFSASRFLKKGWSLNMSLPVNANSRSSTSEHDNIHRHTTRSFGIGDIRITADKWLFKPSGKQKWNVQPGLGIKLPTGDYKHQDYFYRNDTTKVLAPVNPSIQAGDGGTGIIGELNTFFSVNTKMSFFGNLYYLINPRNQNGVSTTAGRTPTSLQIQTRSAEASVPDQYSIRAGANYNLNRISFSGAFRYEGIPVYDLLGKSDGFRRSGHNLSLEPGIIYTLKYISVYTYVPIIIGRRTKQTVSDKIESEATGNYVLKPGGFANYLVFVGASFNF